MILNRSESFYRNAMFFLIAALLLYRITFVLRGELLLAAEEMQYWDWSRRLDFSYYSKPPVIAYLIRLSTEIFGNTVFGVRAVAIGCGLILSFVTYFFVKYLYNSEKIAFFTTLMLNCIPLYSIGAIVITTDTPLMMFWGACCWALWVAISSNKPGYWILAALLMAFGILSKYAMIYLFAGLFSFLVLAPGKRYLLRTPWPYLFIVLSSFAFLPIIYWNIQHDWINFKHLAGNAGVDKGFRIDPGAFFGYIGEQIALANPVIFLTGWGFLVIALRGKTLFSDDRSLFLICIGLSVFFILLLKSIQSKVLGNWAAPAYYTFTIYTVAQVVMWMESRPPTLPLSKAVKSSMVLAVALPTLFAILFMERSIFVTISRSLSKVGIDTAKQIDPGYQFIGWKETGELATKYLEQMPNQEQTFVFSRSYQIAAGLAFWTKGQPRVYCVNIGRRLNQYDVWGGLEELKGWDAIYVVRGNETDLMPSTAAQFESWDGPFKYDLYVMDRPYHRYTVYKLYNFSGEYPPVISEGGLTY